MDSKEILKEIYGFIDFSVLYNKGDCGNPFDYLSKHGIPTRILMNVYVFKDSEKKSFVTANTLFIEESEFIKYKNKGLAKTREWIDNGINKITDNAKELLQGKKVKSNNSEWEFYTVSAVTDWIMKNNKVVFLNESKEDIILFLKKFSDEQELAKKWMNACVLSESITTKKCLSEIENNNQLKDVLVDKDKLPYKTLKNNVKDEFLEFFTKNYIEKISWCLDNENSADYTEFKNNFFSNYDEKFVSNELYKVMFTWLKMSLDSVRGDNLSHETNIKLGNLIFGKIKDFSTETKEAITTGISKLMCYDPLNYSYLNNSANIKIKKSSYGK